MNAHTALPTDETWGVADLLVAAGAAEAPLDPEEEVEMELEAELVVMDDAAEDEEEEVDVEVEQDDDDEEEEEGGWDARCAIAATASGCEASSPQSSHQHRTIRESRQPMDLPLGWTHELVQTKRGNCFTRYHGPNG